MPIEALTLKTDSIEVDNILAFSATEICDWLDFVVLVVFNETIIQHSTIKMSILRVLVVSHIP
jgi:hypothetical protein